MITARRSLPPGAALPEARRSAFRLLTLWPSEGHTVALPFSSHGEVLMRSPTQHPRLVAELGGNRFYIGDTPLHAGDGVVVEFSDDVRVEFRFEWSARLDSSIWLYPARGPGLAVHVDTFKDMFTCVPESPAPRFRP